MIVTVIDADQPAKAVVAIFDIDTVGQRLDQQPSRRITLIARDPLRAVVAELGFFQQLSIEIVGIRGALAIESGFLSDQSIERVVQQIFTAGLILDFGQQQPCVVVPIKQLCAIGIDPAADQMQIIGIFKARGAPQFIPFGGDLAVGVVAEGATGTCRKRRLNQSSYGIP
ncbi:hypothetical protein D3C84_554710 [compost metagenome]